jgi:hypothetical protein
MYPLSKIVVYRIMAEKGLFEKIMETERKREEKMG